MTGYEIRLKRFFPEDENIVVLAVDHGLFMGPVPGLQNFPEAVDKLSKADAILMAPWMARKCGDLWTRKNRPNMLLRLNWASGHHFAWGYHKEVPTELIYPEDALSMGADCALASLSLFTGDESVDAANVKVFSEMIRRKEKCGLPVIAEYYPLREDRNEEQVAQDVYNISRMACELGADGIKTFYIGKLTAELVRHVPMPVLVLGGDKTDKEVDALRKAQAGIQAGARGVVFGRNVFQAKNPQAFLDALIEVTKERSSPEDAAKKFALL